MCLFCFGPSDACPCPVVREENDECGDCDDDGGGGAIGTAATTTATISTTIVVIIIIIIVVVVATARDQGDEQRGG